MSSIIWGAFGLALILIVVVGATTQYIKDREKYKKKKHEEWNRAVEMSVKPKEEVVKAPDISEPVTSFIKCFKENPKRFKVINFEGFLSLKDTQENTRWAFMMISRFRDGKIQPRLHSVDKRLQWLTDSEGEAIVEAVYPYFVTERRDRLHAIQRERLTRIYKERE